MPWSRGVDSPSLIGLAALTRKEEPEAQELFKAAVDELAMATPNPPEGRWQLVHWWCHEIVGGRLRPGGRWAADVIRGLAGTRLSGQPATSRLLDHRGGRNGRPTGTLNAKTSSAKSSLRQRFCWLGRGLPSGAQGPLISVALLPDLRK